MVTKNAINSTIPIEISKGGTNSISFATNTGVVKSDGTSLVTSTTALIDASNRMTNTSQPAFEAIQSGNQANKTGNGTDYQIICNSEIYDQAGNYNNATGVFTAPVTGRYRFSNRVAYISLTTANNFKLSLVTTNRSYIQQMGNQAINNFWQAGSEFCDMTAGDTATLHTIVTGQGADTLGIGGSATSANTYFSGYLVC